MTAYSPVYTNSDHIYAKTGLTSAEVDLTNFNLDLIQDAELELEELTGRKFTDANTRTEYITNPPRDAVGTTGNKATRIRVAMYPIESVTAFNILNLDGSLNKAYATLTAGQIAAGTIYTADYWLTGSTDPLTNLFVPNGRIELSSDDLTPGLKAQITYTHGYATVPVPIRALATCLAGIRAWIRFLGGSYNRLNSYSIPEQAVNKGDFYQRGQQSINLLQEEADRLLDRIGRRPRILFYTTSGDR